jgi:GMP synthase-like glutamine amidotransferase
MAPSAIVVRHAPFEGLGRLEEALDRAGVSLRYFEIGQPIPDDSLRTSDALILMGGPMSANDPEPWVRNELAAVEAALEYSRPVLGICLGAQLLARALGARVYRNRVKEIGWFPIDWTESAAGDRLFGDFRSPETVLHWHGETFDLPADAAWLARSERCIHQAFRYGENNYGLQFHIEVTPGMIADWLQQGANCADVRELDSPIDPYACAARQAELSRIVFDRWIGAWASPSAAANPLAQTAPRSVPG